MQKQILIVIILLMAQLAIAQHDIQYKTKRTSKYSPELAEQLHKVSIFPLGYAYEKKIGQEFTIEMGADFSFDTYYKDASDFQDYALAVNPTIHLEPRYYYNLERRYRRGRNVSNNAASYIGIYSELILNPLIEENNNYFPVYDRFRIGPAWGMQRNIGKRGYWNLNLASGLVIDQDGHASYQGFGRLTIGIRLNGVVE